MPDVCKVMTTVFAQLSQLVIVNWGQRPKTKASPVMTRLVARTLPREIYWSLAYFDGITGDDSHHDGNFDKDDIVLVVDANEIGFQCRRRPC